MKVQITHLKAPWPTGAGVGDVVELHVSELPAWALGKCTPAAADATVFGPATGVPMAPAAGAALDADAAASLAAAEAQAAAERPALEAAASKPTKAKRTAAAAG